MKKLFLFRFCLIPSLVIALATSPAHAEGSQAPFNDLSRQLENIAEKRMSSIVAIIGVSSNHRGGCGTGFFITKDGYLLTNFHVIDGHKAFLVETSDGKVYRDVTVIGVDPDTDLAVLKISGETSFDVLPFGDSESVRLGQIVCAIGHGNFHKGSITMGVVSARRDQLPDNDLSYIDMIQTDVSVNPGNSGGP